MNKLNVLLVDDDDQFSEAFLLLGRSRFNLSRVDNGEKALQFVEQNSPDAILLDLQLGDGMDGLETLRTLRKRMFDIPVIMITEHAGVNTAVEAMQLGAMKYMAKSPNMLELEIMLEHELQHLNWKKLYQNRDDVSDLMIGKSKALQQVKRQIAQAAKNDITVIFEGENGVGKDVAARLIHRQSQRSDKPFVPVNCSAIPASLFESEFFGHEKGAFTGAIRQKKGWFELAGSGIIFLDEISSLDLQGQGKLLRVLDNHSFHRVGGEQLLTANARVLAATNKPLAQEVEAGRFRRDLYYRLNVLTIEIPPLRMHKEDIPDLVHYFVSTFPDAPKNTVQFSRAAMQKLKSYFWPGNIRELKNVVHRALAMSNAKNIQADDIQFDGSNSDGPQLFQDVLSKPYAQARDHVLTEFKKYYLINLLNRNGWSIARAAAETGLPRPSLHRMIKELNLKSGK